MTMTLGELIEVLRQIEEELPQMIDDHPEDGDFWPAFAGTADQVEVLAAPEHYEFVRSRINCMLGAAGLVPSDNEGEDCVP